MSKIQKEETLQELKTFNISPTKQIESSEKEWKSWYESEKPEAEEIPCSYSTTLDSFRKLLLIRSWSPDRTISQAKKYIEESLGPEYSEMQILDLDATWLESEPRTPLVCILSIGSDPTTQIATLAKNKGIRKFAVFFLNSKIDFSHHFIPFSSQIRINGPRSRVSCQKNDCRKYG